MWLSDGVGLTKDFALERFQLWGLTLSIVNDLCQESGLRKSKIDRDLLETLGLTKDDEDDAEETGDAKTTEPFREDTDMSEKMVYSDASAPPGKLPPGKARL